MEKVEESGMGLGLYRSSQLPHRRIGDLRVRETKLFSLCIRTKSCQYDR